jgi:outer membrane receptor protein involved in Fe transport
MNSFLRIVVVLLLVAAPARAQDDTQGTVRGTVVAEDGGSIPGASVALHTDDADSTLVTGAATADDGSFVIENVPAGRYYLRVSYIGYASAIRPDIAVSDEQTTVNVGEVTIRQRSEQLDNVEVTAERQYMQVEPEMTTYSPQNQPALVGGSARSVLEDIPSLRVDIAGNISFRGNEGVAIHINGSPTPLSGEALTSFLESLSAQEVNRVEVISNPSVARNPEGTGGIVNIVLADDAEIGWGGGVSASADTRGRLNGSGNAHYGSGPWKAYFNYGARYDQDEQSGFRYRENLYLDPTTYLEQDRWEQESGLSHTGRLSLDYNPSESNTFSLSSVLSYRSDETEEMREYSELDEDQELTERYNRRTNAEETDFSMEYEFEYSHVWTPREHEFDLEMEYEEDHESEDETYVHYALPLDASNDVADTLTSRQTAIETEDEREASLEADYQRARGESFDMEAGYDGEFEWQDSRYDSESVTGGPVDTLGAELNRDNSFLYAEQTHSLYSTLEGELDDFGAKLGLRAESAITRFDQETQGTSYDNNYFSFFPSVHLSYQIGESNTFKASYSKRVRRPSTWQLNPLGSYDDPTFRRVGNPSLTPEYTHSFELGYTRPGSKYTISLSPYYRYTVDEISWSERLTEDGVTILTFENFSTEDSYGAELVGSLTLDEWLKSNASFNAYKQVTDGSNLSSSLSSDAIGFRTRASFNAEVGWGVTVQASQHYRSPMDIPGGRRDARTRTNMAIQKKLFSNRAKLNVHVSDVFGTRGSVVERRSERYFRRYSREPSSRDVRVTFRYTFGGGGSDGGRRRGRGRWR